MHIFTHLKPEQEGVTGQGIYADGMVEHDGQVGQLLDKLDELGIAENTIVMYSTDNGAETFSWPDGGTTMFRGEKNTNWEGGYRVPTLIRWPGVIEPGTVINDVAAHEDMLTTLLAAAGEPEIKEELLQGKQVGDRSYKVHLDGYDLGPALKGEADWPRRDFLYWTDDGSVAALRYDAWKITFLVQEAVGLPCGGTVHGAARPAHHQPADGPLRARRGGERHGIPAVVRRADVPARSGRGLCRQLAAELPRVPAAAEAGQLQPGPRDGSGHRGLARGPVIAAPDETEPN